MDTIVEGDARAASVPSCSMQVTGSGTTGLVIPVVEVRTERDFLQPPRR
ncbi:hypothetical protein [Burkholderia sp. S171]|nr:hypothetical protein [Burkholderia sp. S171]